MVFTCKEKLPIRKLFSHLDDFNQDFLTGKTVGGKQENATVIEGTCDQEYTVEIPSSDLAANENLVKA